MLVVRLVVQSVFFFAFSGALFFVPAGTLHAWPAWTYFGVFAFASVAMSAWLLRADRALLERRLALGEKGERRNLQRFVQALAGPAFFGMFVASGLEWRWMPNHVPAAIVVAGNAMVVLGFLACFFVFRANSFASSIVEVGKEQRVISTGPYGLVRHPMYTGGFVLIAGTPVALGSYWGEFFFVPLFVLIVMRMFDEEKLLSAKLPGYAEYMQTVRFRLVPGIW